jgi:hypothetical protein
MPVVAITSEDTETVSTFLESFGSDFPQHIALDPRGLVTDAFNARSYPTFVLVDENGTVHAFKKGYSTLRDLTRP